VRLSRDYYLKPKLRRLWCDWQGWYTEVPQKQLPLPQALVLPRFQPTKSLWLFQAGHSVELRIDAVTSLTNRQRSHASEVLIRLPRDCVHNHRQRYVVTNTCAGKQARSKPHRLFAEQILKRSLGARHLCLIFRQIRALLWFEMIAEICFFFFPHFLSGRLFAMLRV
jgi:hypothetical protein